MDATTRKTWLKGTRLAERLRRSIRKLKPKTGTAPRNDLKCYASKMCVRTTEHVPSPNTTTVTIRGLPVCAKPRSRPAPPHLTLLGLPRELRDLIYSFVFAQAGMNYVREQLLGFPSGDHSNHSITFRVLLTCQQIYNEAFPIAYQLTCFYWFRSFTMVKAKRLLFKLNERQAQIVRHVAYWSNPYTCEDFLEQIPSHLRLTQLTICSNYMSGPLAPAHLEERATWILKNLRRLKGLKRFRFLTGCGVAPEEMGKTDFGLAVDLRTTFGFGWMRAIKEEQRVEVGTFETDCTAVVRLLPREDDGDKIREVRLKVASVYEDGFADG